MKTAPRATGRLPPLRLFSTPQRFVLGRPSSFKLFLNVVRKQILIGRICDSANLDPYLCLAKFRAEIEYLNGQADPLRKMVSSGSLISDSGTIR